jgi:hypothetical protein
VGRPSELELRGASALLAPWRALADPRFFGLEHVPREGPMLLVGNHTVFGLVDLPLMLIGLYEARGRNEGGRAARGLRDRVKRAVEDQIAFCLDERERDPSAISCRVSPPGSRPERVRSQSATATSCPGCGLVLPERRGP